MLGPGLTWLAQASNAARAGSEIARRTAGHRTAVLIVGALVLIVIVVLLVRLRRES